MRFKYYEDYSEDEWALLNLIEKETIMEISKEHLEKEIIRLQEELGNTAPAFAEGKIMTTEIAFKQLRENTGELLTELHIKSFATIFCNKALLFIEHIRAIWGKK